MANKVASWDYQVSGMQGEGMISIDDIPGWLVACVAWVLLLAFVFVLLLHELSLGHAAMLSISGSAAGNGSQIFSVAGDNITAVWNGTTWNVTGAF
jgi:hypothetical protein